MQISEINSLINDLKLLGSKQKAESLQRFFKTAKGQYAYGDLFWGIPVPQTRKIARKYKDLNINLLHELLENKVHEVRFCALIIMILQSKNIPKQITNLYLKKTKFINNWDLVDVSAEAIVGRFLLNRDCSLLYSLAKSESLWERRIAIIATFAFIKQGDYEHTVNIARILMHDQHDLIHKAVGWMLREIGKRCSQEILENFLEEYAVIMPRTMLRYAIEHLSVEKKMKYLRK